jgi:hypothetical protein
MLMQRVSLQQASPTGQVLRQTPPTGVAQRSGTKSGAKRFDLGSDRNAPAWNQADPRAFTLKAFSLSAPRQPLNFPNIQSLSYTQRHK